MVMSMWWLCNVAWNKISIYFLELLPLFFALFNSENKWNYSSEIQTHALSQHQNLRNCQVTIFAWKAEETACINLMRMRTLFKET